MKIIDARLDEIDLVLNGKIICGVRPRRPFPYTHPEIILLYKEGEELGMLRNYKELDRKSRKLLEKVLSIIYYMPEIKRIYNIKRERGKYHWKVLTDKGEMEFNTWSKCIRLLPDGRLIIKDVDERVYHVKSIERLDAKSRLYLEIML